MNQSNPKDKSGVSGLFDLMPKVGQPLSFEKMQINLHNTGLIQYDADCAYDILVKMFNDQGTELRCANISDKFEHNLRQKGFNVTSTIDKGTDDTPWDMKWVVVKWPKEDSTSYQ